MTDSLRDQLLGLGFKPTAKPEPRPPRDARKAPSAGAPPPSRPASAHAHARPAHARPGSGKPGSGKPGSGSPGAGRHGPGKPGSGRAAPAHGKPAQAKQGPRPREDIDLAKAYAIRAQKEKDQRIEAERLKQEEARKRREARARLAEALKDKALNDPAAEIARHFPYGGKIKRVYVTEAQLKRLNAGELGVVQLEGRYLLVDAATLALADSLFAPAVALKVDPDAPVGDDPYADPKFQVPDDLVW